MTRRIPVRSLVLLGLFSAIIILQTYVPFLGYLKLFGLIDLTIIHITVLLGACLMGPYYGAALGGVWGITSMLYAYSSAGILNPLFYNPLISVIPRVIVGLVAGFLFHLLSKRFSTTISAVVASVAGTITNTALVLSGFYFFGYTFLFNTLNLSADGPTDGVVTFILSLIGTNTSAEIISAALIVPAIVVPLQHLFKKITK